MINLVGRHSQNTDTVKTAFFVSRITKNKFCYEHFSNRHNYLVH